MKKVVLVALMAAAGMAQAAHKNESLRAGVIASQPAFYTPVPLSCPDGTKEIGDDCVPTVELDIDFE
ncbi:hypothetical protein [Pseudomonas peradeniyensis]|uniref:Porin n=1 Tax=Pseudomonas peradeniyensis TaxID=2745488 RepID=A0ABT2VA36_9PSED|nr:hypothetical protein [Pseudomonas peradeniyensis]MCU7238198.1 hypothetical protein [Pseudomonas peradeniyensis]